MRRKGEERREKKVKRERERERMDEGEKGREVDVRFCSYSGRMVPTAKATCLITLT